MTKKSVKINENTLKKIITSTVRKVLKEYNNHINGKKSINERKRLFESENDLPAREVVSFKRFCEIAEEYGLAPDYNNKQDMLSAKKCYDNLCDDWDEGLDATDYCQTFEDSVREYFYYMGAEKYDSGDYDDNFEDIAKTKGFDF